MTADVLFVLGAPGAGKTTLVRTLLGDHEITDRYGVKVTIGETAIAAGYYKGDTFDGADTVPYTGALPWLASWYENMLDKIPQAELTILDGDRFSTQPVLDFLRGVEGVRIRGVYLDVRTDKLVARRAKRGSNQNEIWLKGRATKARNFAQKIGAATIDANTCDAFAIVDDVDSYLSDWSGS